MRVNLLDDDYYQIETVVNEASVDFIVYEYDGNHTDIDNGYEVYLKGTIKWDGCSHINFGDEGYIHLCGKYWFDKHIEVMKAVWNICTKDWNDLSREIGGELY